MRFASHKQRVAQHHKCEEECCCLEPVNSRGAKPCAALSDPTQDRGRQCKKGQSLGEEINSPANPFIAVQGLNPDGRCEERSEEHGKEGILREGLQAVQTGLVQEIANAPGGDENLGAIGQDEPHDRTHRDSGLQVV